MSLRARRSVALLALLAGLLGVVSVARMLLSPYVEDAAARGRQEDRSSTAVRDLDTLTSPALTRPAGPAGLGVCSMDSGELFQPSAGREWALTGRARLEDDRAGVTVEARGAVSQLARQLTRLGWSGSTRPDADASVELTRREAGLRSSVVLQAFDDSVLATVTTDEDETVCRMRPGLGWLG